MTLSFMPQTQGAKMGFLFPGQGAQAVGMGKQLYDESPAAREVFAQVDEALGRSLSDIMFNGPEDTLRQTINAQPGIMAVSLACMKTMQERLGDDMPQPAMTAGHSLGEYTALAVSGVLDVGDTAFLVQRRGELMQVACDQNPGTMAAIIGLDEMTLEQIAVETGTYVSNINTAEQIVISGDKLGVARACDLSTARGAKKAIPLRVGGAFHSGLMEPGARRAYRSHQQRAVPRPADSDCRQLRRAAAEHSGRREARAHHADLRLRAVEAHRGLHGGLRRQRIHRSRTGQGAIRHGQAHIEALADYRSRRSGIHPESEQELGSWQK